MNQEVEDIVFRLHERARIRRQVSTRRSVQEGKPDRIADILDEAANCILRLRADQLNLLARYDDMEARS